MTLNRKNPKRDKNENVIIEALRMAGAFVTSLSDKGIPDLLVIFRGNVFFLEVKSDGGRLTTHQVAWHAEALNHGVKVHIVKSVHDALLAIGAIDS
jgi:hypothetical protein